MSTIAQQLAFPMDDVSVCENTKAKVVRQPYDIFEDNDVLVCDNEHAEECEACQ